MKKSLIAAAGATLAVSAMPVLGVFADDPLTASFSDQITVTVSQGCVFRSTGGGTAWNDETRVFTETATPGQLLTIAGTGTTGTHPAIEFYCTDDGTTHHHFSYSIIAKGDGSGSNKNELHSADAGDINTNANTTSGTLSAWALSVDGGTNYVAVPNASGSEVKSGNGETGTAVEFNPQYRVYIGTNQVPGTFTGKVVYTLSATLTD